MEEIEKQKPTPRIRKVEFSYAFLRMKTENAVMKSRIEELLDEVKKFEHRDKELVEQLREQSGEDNRYQEGYDAGYQEGEQRILDDPSDWSLYSQSDYDDAKDESYEEGKNYVLDYGCRKYSSF